MNLTLTATKNANGTHTISWTSSVTTKVHTIQLVAWFGKKKNSGTKLFPFYVWSTHNPNNGAVEMNGERTINPSLWDSTWQQANYEGYICQFDTVDSPKDQYNCIEGTAAKITKK